MKWVLLAPMLSSTGIIAAGSSGGIDPTVTGYLTVLQVPVFGALAWALLTGRIRTRDEMERVVKERDTERDERIQAQQALTGSALPAVLQLQETMKQATEIITRLEDRLTIYEADAITKRPTPRSR